MPNHPGHKFELVDVPTAESVDLLIANLQSDHVRRSVSPRNHAHRSRVIRQQTARLRLLAVSDRGSML